MNISESATFAIRGVTANKMRSALTTLGILIGVASVITLVAVGNGSSQAVQNSISKLGSNTLTVTASQGGTGGRGGGGGFAALFGGGAGRVNSGTQTKTATLTLANAQALTDKNLAPDVQAVAPVVSSSSVTSTYNGATHSIATVVGTSPSYLGINNDTVQSGVAFSDSDYTQHRRVVLLGTTVATDLFGGTGSSAVGKTILMGGAQYEVIGILTAKGSTGPNDQDDRAIAPLPAIQDTLTGYASLNSISVQATSATSIPAAEAEVTSILVGLHHVTTATADFTVSSASSILSAATSSTQTFTVLLAAVAGISLLVGGIGVMNIMLVTVTERTREIGIRKAIGAGKGDIVSQFLFEAVLLSILGGLAGIVIGLFASKFEIVGVQPVVVPASIALAFGVAVTVGLFFGLYPASRAASLRPIDALRYE